MLITFTPTHLVTGGDGKLEIGLQHYDSHDQAEGKEHKALSDYTRHTAYRIEHHSLYRTLPVR